MKQYRVRRTVGFDDDMTLLYLEMDSKDDASEVFFDTVKEKAYERLSDTDCNFHVISMEVGDELGWVLERRAIWREQR